MVCWPIAKACGLASQHFRILVNLSLTVLKRTTRKRSARRFAIVDIRTKLEQNTNILKTGESYV